MRAIYYVCLGIPVSFLLLGCSPSYFLERKSPETQEEKPEPFDNLAQAPDPAQRPLLLQQLKKYQAQYEELKKKSAAVTLPAPLRLPSSSKPAEVSEAKGEGTKGP